VELLYTDGTLIDIECMVVEDQVVRNMYEWSERDCLLCNKPMDDDALILNGDMVEYLEKCNRLLAVGRKEGLKQKSY
jgi:phosphoribosyl-dephospho-CoA transferase